MLITSDPTRVRMMTAGLAAIDAFTINITMDQKEILISTTVT